MSFLDDAWDKTKDLGKTFSGAKALEEIVALRADQEQLNLALAVRLKDLQASVNLARKEAEEALAISEQCRAEVRETLRIIERERSAAVAVIDDARGLAEELGAGVASSQGIVTAVEHDARNRRWLLALTIVVVLMVVAVVWLSVRSIG
jgi:hypothetical protein